MSAADLSLMHYAAAPVALDRTHTYKQDDFKPNGLWVSVAGEDDWPEWCRREEFREDTLTHAHEVVILDDSNILVLDTPEAILDMGRRYPSSGSLSRWAEVDWTKVAATYDGIVIAPYQWSLRLDPRAHWYYTWDCASGCIWNLDVLDISLCEQVAS